MCGSGSCLLYHDSLCKQVLAASDICQAACGPWLCCMPIIASWFFGARQPASQHRWSLSQQIDLTSVLENKKTTAMNSCATNGPTSRRSAFLAQLTAHPRNLTEIVLLTVSPPVVPLIVAEP